ncbi:MAG: ABC transporter ATP-binding protein, partial [Spirochaetaceae bacterium]|nr:ABC transporter ATP-binding protein [Spirochaetaceae bacterium]
MSMVKKLLSGLERKYKASAVLAPVTIMGEVLLEVLIPLIMAKIIDVGIANKDAAYVIKTGCLMVGAALMSLSFGVVAGRFAAVAALGFARNLRRRLFSKVQDFSFANVDKFSTASLVTRLTSDVTNAQNTFQMIVRMCVRSPFMFISAIIMAFYMNAKLSLVFVACIPLIAIPMVLIMRKAHPRFQV